MPLSDHEQRMLDQIESALYAEDPKFASSVRGGGLRAPSARRRLQGAALFVIGLAMLVCGVAFKATMIGSFPILSVFGFLVMFGGVVFAITGPRVTGGRDRSGTEQGASSAEAGQGFGRVVHQPDGRPVPPPLRRITHLSRWGSQFGCPIFCAPRVPTSPHSRCDQRVLRCPRQGFALDSAVTQSLHVGKRPATFAGIWSKVGDCGVKWRAMERPGLRHRREVARCSSAPTRPSSTTRGG